VVSKPTDAQAVNDAFRAAAEGPMRGILAVSDEPLVSSDYIGDFHSGVVDALSTQVIDGNLVHVTAWYDNEMGYSMRCADLLELVASKL
jgi:glyceraldehyde 3-phosphate dehydrogenase